MGVESRSGDELAVSVDESARAPTIDVLTVLAAVAEEALGHARGDGRLTARARLREVNELLRQAGESTGPVRVVGRPDLIVEAIRTIASQAAYELDILLETLATTRDPLSKQAIAQIRTRAAAAAGAVEALVACEADRHAT